MSIRMMNPVAQSHIEAFRRPVRIEELHGRRLGFLFECHVSAVKFWKQLEDLVADIYHPRSVISLRKENTFAPPQPRAKLPNSRLVQSWSLSASAPRVLHQRLRVGRYKAGKRGHTHCSGRSRRLRRGGKESRPKPGGFPISGFSFIPSRLRGKRMIRLEARRGGWP